MKRERENVQYYKRPKYTCEILFITSRRERERAQKKGNSAETVEKENTLKINVV